ncbi:sensor of ECF-type sigma factor [Flavobacterium croceum]|jgi:Spy/CpxP family protein refolding chaperone|uniref:LTXXQ motif family protein n=1 Tax=Flavobacterium croceum DSM 17960 TaxID=1121886 RepID=A0A2S4N7B8_9FLAO|nr:sensor of ECF-type sigma factor [Flavobacterium croceum]POS01615.1 hypothetical protein Q361_10975 [Flavobacterium croceum DSM 17960]
MKILKNITFLFIILVSFNTWSQRGRLAQKKEEVKSLKVAFITNELDLTTAEAEKFWPLFNEFEKKQNDIRKQKLKNYIDRSDAENLSEKDAASLLVQMETAEEELFQLRKKFIASLKNVLPASKIIKLKRAEDKFSKKLLQQIRDNKR